jgi:hypothetical protein
VFFPALNTANVIGVEIGRFGQPFLAPMKPLPLFADGGTQNYAVIL